MRAIFTIAQFGSLEEFKKNFNKDKINLKNENGSDLIHISIAGRKYDIANFLIDNNINIDTTNQEGQTPFQYLVIGYSDNSEQERIILIKRMLETGKIPATSETFVSKSAAYSSKYEGILIEFKVNNGTEKQLLNIGVKHRSEMYVPGFPDMPVGSKGWLTRNEAYFKLEDGTRNIGLGKRGALETFNQNIISYKQIPKQ